MACRRINPAAAKSGLPPVWLAGHEKGGPKGSRATRLPLGCCPKGRPPPVRWRPSRSVAEDKCCRLAYGPGPWTRLGFATCCWWSRFLGGLFAVISGAAATHLPSQRHFANRQDLRGRALANPKAQTAPWRRWPLAPSPPGRPAGRPPTHQQSNCRPVLLPNWFFFVRFGGCVRQARPANYSRVARLLQKYEPKPEVQWLTANTLRIVVRGADSSGEISDTSAMSMLRNCARNKNLSEILPLALALGKINPDVKMVVHEVPLAASLELDGRVAPLPKKAIEQFLIDGTLAADLKAWVDASVR
eukprot:GHVT01023425.1.p1 GENE.GHVT01023425.1~~GHVT01023425.1.p1  ORF type:complete len:302 (+),score=48.16 GHVT01023425.1:536-1441(+)